MNLSSENNRQKILATKANVKNNILTFFVLLIIFLLSFFYAAQRNILHHTLFEYKKQYQNRNHYDHTARHSDRHIIETLYPRIAERIYAVCKRRMCGKIQQRRLVIVPISDKLQQKYRETDIRYQRQGDSEK